MDIYKSGMYAPSFYFEDCSPKIEFRFIQLYFLVLTEIHINTYLNELLQNCGSIHLFKFLENLSFHK